MDVALLTDSLLYSVVTRCQATALNANIALPIVRLRKAFSCIDWGGHCADVWVLASAVNFVRGNLSLDLYTDRSWKPESRQ